MASAETAAEYIARSNVQALMEWMTAELIMHRPDDPLAFSRDLLGRKISERGGVVYAPEHATDYVRSSYLEASALVDENGVVPEQVFEAGDSVTADLEAFRAQVTRLEKLRRATTAIAGQLDPKMATDAIVQECCSLLDADRATMYTMDTATNELVLAVAEGAEYIRIPLGQGIAGSVAQSGEIINIRDAYADDRFDSAHDQATGYKTNTILACPVKSGDGDIIGVLQVINKRGGQFIESDVEVLELLSQQAGIAMQNARHFEESEKSRNKFRSLLDLIRAVQSDMGASSLIFTITQRTPSVADADRCTLYLVDNQSKGLYAMQGEVNIRIPMNEGIAGTVAGTGDTINIPDAYADERFNQQVDKKMGYKTNTILCLPIKCGDEVIGVLQLINKLDGGVFSPDDEEVLMLFLSIIAPVLQQSELYQQMQGRSGGSASEPTNELKGSSVTPRSRASANPKLGGLAEATPEGGGDGDEEEEEDDGGW